MAKPSPCFSSVTSALVSICSAVSSPALLPLTAINTELLARDVQGAVVMGIGMALSEETVFDERRGRILNGLITDEATAQLLLRD